MISVITPSVRPEMLTVISKCLSRQDAEFEWLICSPKKYKEQIDVEYPYRFITEPSKKEGDYYGLCKAFNALFSQAKGELVVMIQDGIWFPPDLLEKLWSHYKANPKALVTCVGHQYDQVDEAGKPTNMMWKDPRARQDFGTFYEVPPIEMEFTICSIPRQALVDCGGVDEEYDKGAAVCEKEMCLRLDELGYKFFIDQTLEYKAIHHPRLSTDWDEKYKISSELFIKHVSEIKNGTRTLNVNSLNY